MKTVRTLILICTFLLSGCSWNTASVSESRASPGMKPASESSVIETKESSAVSFGSAETSCELSELSDIETSEFTEPSAIEPSGSTEAGESELSESSSENPDENSEETSETKADNTGGKRALLDAVELEPQTAPDAELNAVIDDLFAEIFTDGMDTYDKVRTCYLYLVQNMTYAQIPVYPEDCFVYNSAYRALTTHMGVCDDYSNALIMMMRRIGITDVYRINGWLFTKSGNKNGHAWVLLRIDGSDYIFDPQADQSAAKKEGIECGWYYFCRPETEVSKKFVCFDDYPEEECIRDFTAQFSMTEEEFAAAYFSFLYTGSVSGESTESAYSTEESCG